MFDNIYVVEMCVEVGLLMWNVRVWGLVYFVWIEKIEVCEDEFRLG